VGVRQTCYDWFCKGIADLEPDTQSQLFQKEILKMDLSKLTPTGLLTDILLMFSAIYYASLPARSACFFIINIELLHSVCLIL